METKMDQGAVIKTIRQFKKALESLNIQVEQLILSGSAPGSLSQKGVAPVCIGLGR
jgi:hypothetical protein